ncbi:MAG: TIGR00730 family Rossman fold protein [Smithella sp.]
MEEKQYVVDALSINESWRVFRIMAEFVEGIETLSQVENGVTIFGSARIKPDNIYYQKTENLARLLVKDGFNVITGGGPGVMEAANKGASEAGGKSVGLNIRLPFEQKPNPYANIHIDYKYFFVRKVMFVKYAVAYVIMPGGFGTMDEFFEALTLIQTKKIKSFPLILMGREYWHGLIGWLKNTMLEEGKISPADMDLIQIVDEPEEVVKLIKKYVIV